MPGITAMQDLAARSGTVLVEGTRDAGAAAVHRRGPDAERGAGTLRHRRRLQGRPAVRRGARRGRRRRPARRRGYGARLGLRRRAGAAGRAERQRHRRLPVDAARCPPSATAAAASCDRGHGESGLRRRRARRGRPASPCGAPRRIAAADIVIWAASLVHEDVLQHARADAEIVDSAQLPLEGVTALLRAGGARGAAWSRGSTPATRRCGARSRSSSSGARTLGLETEVVPGVSSFQRGRRGRRQRELTIPEVAQSVDAHPARGRQDADAAAARRSGSSPGTARRWRCSCRRPAPGSCRRSCWPAATTEETPCVVAYQRTWPDELVVRCRLDELAATVKEHKLYKHTLVLVGPALGGRGTRSHLYHPGHFHGFRRAEPAGRAQGTQGIMSDRTPAARAGPAADHEGQAAGPSNRLDDRDLRERRRQGGSVGVDDADAARTLSRWRCPRGGG